MAPGSPGESVCLFGFATSDFCGARRNSSARSRAAEGSESVKYAALSLMFFANNEILSYIALSIMAVLVCADILKARVN